MQWFTDPRGFKARGPTTLLPLPITPWISLLARVLARHELVPRLLPVFIALDEVAPLLLPLLALNEMMPQLLSS
jgi:hypothetical protein